ncbi:MAG: hypothetical protein ACXVFT_24415 [Solirubrobacteraceae bacterium]
MRRLWVTVLLLAALVLPEAARAADPLGLACADQGDGIRLCQGKVKTFDGVPLDANLALPAGSNLPLVVLSHGYGGSKLGYAEMKPWAAIASYRLPAATGDGYTLLGAPTAIADLELTGSFPALALRLLDVAPNGTQTLVARGLYRPTADGRQVFQLHPGAWHFASGHVARLELLGRDAPYGRASNGPSRWT